MAIRYQIIRQLADGRFHSGEALAHAFGVSRAAVWKQLKLLQEQLQMDLHAVSGRGYRLVQPLELLDPQQILGGLSPEAHACINGLDVHDCVDSTNAHLMRLASEGAPSGRVCLAEQQTAGRGRRGREWVSPYGSNIYLSILWRYPLAPVQLSGLSLAAGVATVRALKRLGVKDIGLKWPNDILCQGRKLAGLLLEVAGESQGPSRVVLGLGLNTSLTDAQAQTIDQPWIDLATVPGGRKVSRNRLASELLDQLLMVLTAFESNGLAPLLDEWHEYDLYHGRAISLRMVNRSIEGVHQGIDQTGALLLAVNGKVQAYHAGEVSLRTGPVNG
jgi:BirA family biotin operon repressor/biotin-[acetyl-CoA-carboxylase] ligase